MLIDLVHERNSQFGSKIYETSQRSLIEIQGMVSTGILMFIMLLEFCAFSRSSRKVQIEPAFSPGPTSERQLEAYLGSSLKVKVYVYDQPVFDNSDMIECFRKSTGVPPWMNEEFDMAQNMAEIWLHRSLLEHQWRVLDPDDADVFYVPLYPVLSLRLHFRRLEDACDILPHGKRMTASLLYLAKKSKYFKRFGGADHIVVCTWWRCRDAFSKGHRMLLRRAVLGIYENIDYWAEWGCDGRLVTIPYVASSAITKDGVLGGLHSEQRTIPFFFVGTARNRPERNNLEVVKELFPGSVIELGRSEIHWMQNSTYYADHISRSRFCFCPRGNSFSSRRIFDAIAAGCIPVITEEEAVVLPFVKTGLNYSKFAVVAPSGSFSSIENVTALVKNIFSSSDEVLTLMIRSLGEATESTVYGKVTGENWHDMKPFQGATTRFLVEALRSIADTMWDCPALKVGERRPDRTASFFTKHPVNRTWAAFPPTERTRDQWLAASETIVDRKHSLLICVPPNTGSLQFRMLAKRMQGVPDWAMIDDWSSVFDPVISGIPLLDIFNTSLMTNIYKDNNGGWITIGLVRDPVTRLLSLYFNLVEMLIFRERCSWSNAFIKDYTTWWVNAGIKMGPEETSSSTVIPTFVEIIDTLLEDYSNAPPAFRPISSMCGMGHSPFDTLIPFENLQTTSKSVLMSLPGGIWNEYGESGWGADGNNSFMENDYATVTRRCSRRCCETKGGLKALNREENINKGCVRLETLRIPQRAEDLFKENVCKWVDYYSNEKILRDVEKIYRADYDLFGWYDIEEWIEKLNWCLESQTREVLG